MSGSNAGDYANARKGKTKQAGKVGGGRPAPFFHHRLVDTSCFVLEVHLLLLCGPKLSEWCKARYAARGVRCRCKMVPVPFLAGERVSPGHIILGKASISK